MAPIELADALTIYKVQGSTLDRGQIEFQYSDKSYAETYIAFSRFKRADHFVIIDFESSRYDFTGTSFTAKVVENETKRLNTLAKKTFKKYGNILAQNFVRTEMK